MSASVVRRVERVVPDSELPPHLRVKDPNSVLFRGYVAVSEGGKGRLVPWWAAPSVTDGEEQHLLPPDVRNRITALRARQEQEMIARLHQGLPPIVKIPYREKLKDMVDRLVDMYRKTGRIPESIMRKIEEHYWLQGKGEPGLREALRRYAEDMLSRAEREHSKRLAHNVRAKEGN